MWQNICSRKIATEKGKAMKRTNQIRNLLGVSQEDMAMLVRVSRSQWSMFELGKRDLPLTAMQLLAELLHHVQAPELAAKSLPHDEKQQAQQQQLEHLLKENEYQQLLTTKKINFIERKQANKVRILHVVNFLAAHSTKKGDFEANLLKAIANKATKALEVDGLAVLIKYQIKLEVLGFEWKAIDSRLRK